MTTAKDAPTRVDWAAGSWRNPPVSVTDEPDGGLLVAAAEGSDAWQKTSYGFVHDSEHALLRPFEPGAAIEVDYLATMSEQFDQAGLLVRLDSEHWIKAGTEYADGALRVGAVVTDGYSDWSTAPVADWSGRVVRVRASWADDALTIRAGLVGEPLDLIRLARWPVPAGGGVLAGPYCCAPTRAGFTARFVEWRSTGADAALH